ncbi:metal ABC transporter ATP-binding protein [Desulfosporosinus meridiei]|uniref:ATPase component of Mn/Zn ABC-type transporter n=1 Tax=Desulfosporosinus meridiei (strain ATCC BAA-275 / DSM 13257 / KCTC 12902 / NCIMB 13706 / S10) TaxID=768704 RepID=J7IV38_DESMD|nr:metal ABC transporter ATP-binding protein [Desulfosporosinus meridiei]AFQ42571.1 ATPase component of Mn/Zn ABC-type transporter [Desulfosporosinus meridiei DSM 13257]
MENKTTLDYVVEVEDLTVAYDAKPVLWDVDLKIPRGRLMAIVGPNGAGKTTLLKAMLNLLTSVSGVIRFLPGETGDSPKNKIRIGYVPQSGSVDWDFPATVLDVVLMGRYGLLGWVKRPGKNDVAIAKQTLEKVGMEKFSSRQISQLSGGQQQRVFLARALVQEAEIYFMDEPFKGVDAQTEKAIVQLLKELKAQGKTVVVVHHDLQTVADYFDWVTLINLRVVACGPVKEVFHEENLKTVYRSSGALLKSRV